MAKVQRVKTSPSSIPRAKKKSTQKKPLKCKVKRRDPEDALVATTSVKNRRRKIYAAELRDKLKGGAYIQNLEDAGKSLDLILDKFETLKVRKAKLMVGKDRLALSEVAAQLDILNAQRDAIRVKIELNVRRLRYLLPELKSIELTDPDGNNPLEPIAESMRRLTKLASLTGDN